MLPASQYSSQTPSCHYLSPKGNHCPDFLHHRFYNCIKWNCIVGVHFVSELILFSISYEIHPYVAYKYSYKPYNYIKVKVRVHFFFLYGYPIDPAPFVKTPLFPHCTALLPLWYQVTVCVGSMSGLFCSVLSSFTTTIMS